MKLGDLLDLDLLSAHIRDGYVTERCHPTRPLRILNYAPKAQFERMWDDVTRQCRGLIYREGEGHEIIARPWPKFFNYGEYVEDDRFENNPTLDLHAAVEVTDKLDGSLGILYPTCGWSEDHCRSCGYSIATRGSFDSDQARHANEVWQARYSNWGPSPGWTYLFEIIYPENRVVVDYAGRDDLVLLGAVHIETGGVLGPGADPTWPGPKADVLHEGGFPVVSLRHALELEQRFNVEGVVVRYLGSDVMVKIKQDDYVELHRLVTGLSERVVWERLGAGETWEQIAEGLPDEFAEWVEDVRVGLQCRADNIWSDVYTEYSEILSIMMDDYTRKDFAAEASQSPLAKYLFLLLDGKDIRPPIWKDIRP